MNARGKAIWGSAAGVAAAVVLVALFASLLAHRGTTTPPGSGTPGATASSGTPTPSPTASQTTGGIPGGWTAAKGTFNGWGPDVTFAPSSPSTGYAYQLQQDNSIKFSVSHDGGATWQTLNTPATKQDRCDLSVNPTDARDVLLACTPPASSGFTILRSFDGGVIWTQPHFTVTANCYNGSGWAGSTALLAFSVCENPSSSQTQLLASKNGGPFTRLDMNGQLGGQSLGGIAQLGGNSSVIFVQMGILGFDDTGAHINETTLRSTDGGAIWAQVTFAGGGVHLLAITPDGATLVGVYDSNATQLGLSKDNGQTWQKLPVGTSGFASFNNLVVAPDGTIAAVSSHHSALNNPDERLYVLRAGASAWTTYTMPSTAFPHALAFDGSGHATAVWATYSPGDSPGSPWMLISHPL
jgi:hypothetical protein